MMPAFLLTLITRTGIPQRFAKAAAWIIAAIVVIALCWAAVLAFRGWIATGKEEAIAVNQKDVTIEAYNRVMAASDAADRNQATRDDEFQNDQEELQHEVATKGTPDPVGPATASVLDRMRKQQAAGRRN